ncbi:hypothetical protein [Isoalcanivorax indicus]|uniref:hypothetical protein n=1 Tax=Isoalcanivorax indicus TaxID=2202653 RepID=UPI0013C423C7|nr:hypothetical protein [Isoalcanivorax indicus]
MRLEQGQVLPPRAATLLKVCYSLVLLIVVLGICAWLPEGDGRLWLGQGVNLLVALYLWLLAGLYLAPLFAEDTADGKVQAQGQAQGQTQAPGLGLALMLPLLPAAAAPLMPVAAGGITLLVAVLLLALIEALPSQKALWPASWYQARKQQTQLLVVALVSAAVAAWSVGMRY